MRTVWMAAALLVAAAACEKGGFIEPIETGLDVDVAWDRARTDDLTSEVWQLWQTGLFAGVITSGPVPEDGRFRISAIAKCLPDPIVLVVYGQYAADRSFGCVELNDSTVAGGLLRCVPDPQVVTAFRVIEGCEPPAE